MDSDDEAQFQNSSSEADSGNESSGDEAGLEDRSEPSSSRVDEPPTDDNHYQVLSIEELVDYMVEEINEVKDVAQLAGTTIRILLNHFHWDKERLLERLYDTDQERLFREARIVSPFCVKPGAQATKAKIRRGGVATEECEICLVTHPCANMSGLECGHRFCGVCWAEYLTTKIMEEGMGQTISCAAHDCDILVDDQTVLALVSEQRVLQRYRHLITNSFVECNRCLCWCPTPDCGYAVRLRYPEPRPVVCKCGYRFCFSCSEAWHDPVRCHLIRRWLKKCDDDSETFNWISANTKECPKCNVTIEKDGGCNHMICKNQSCRADFCWVCLGPWEPHGSSWYNCNRYDEKDAKAARHAQECSRTALNRYLFYFNRYMNHMQSLKFENKLYVSVKEKMEEMQQHNMSWIEVQFLKKAVDVLCSCRQTLMYTYAFAYYLSKNNQSHMFEANQKDLENSTEMLSEYLERDITQENLIDIKQKVQDKYRYCEHRRKMLLEHVHEGYERDWWLYNQY